jgi:hypothetical protein
MPETSGPMLFHSVYFALQDKSAEARRKLVAACRQCLSDHPGTLFFAAGERADDIAWSISDQDFDVALHILFADKAAHDVYQEAAKHMQFIEENEDNWKAVRVFDVYAARPTT